MSVYNVHARNPKAKRRAMHVRAWLNGVEVTSQCFYADTRRGVVRLYVLNGDGHKYVDHRTGEVARAECRGRVEVRRT